MFPSLLLQSLVLALILGCTAARSQEADCKYSWYVPPNGMSYSVRSPNYPGNFQPGTTCYWYLYTDVGYNLYLNCFSVNLERVGEWACVDSITVYGTNDINYCMPFNLKSVNNKILLSLQSSFRSLGGNFSCSVQTMMRSCDCGWALNTRVVGGTETGINEFPSMASLIDVRKRSQVCGATIISERYVITAAHCIDALSLPETGVLVGEHNISTGLDTSATRLYRAKRFIVHPGWDRAGIKNDIALVEVDQPIAFSSMVGPICLPFGMPNTPEVGERLTVLGWGTTSFGGPVSDVLMKTGQIVVPMERCQRAHAKYTPNERQQVCTYEKGKDSCQFDSGGPMLSLNYNTVRYFLASIVSYGGICASDDPSVSTRVYNYLEWIVTSTGGEEFCYK